MATRRPVRASIFTGQTLRRSSRRQQVDPSSALAALGGVAYTWDLETDRLSWGPNAPSILNVAPGDLPLTGGAFCAWMEPLGGTSREDALASGSPAHEVRYALRVNAGTAIMVQDSGRVTRSAGGRLVRGFIRSDPLTRGRDTLPRVVQNRTALLCRLHDDVAQALRFSHGATLILGELAAENILEFGEISRLLRPMMRRRDHATALAGNRFALVLASCSRADAPAAMERLAGILTAEGYAVRLAAASTPDHALDACRLLRIAETCLDRPGTGAERTMADFIDLHPPASPRAAESVELIQALNDRQLALALRPVVDAHSVAPAFARALLTLPVGKSGEALLDTPTEPGLAILIDARRLELAANHLVAAPDAHLILPVGKATLGDPEWLSVLAAHLGARPGIASRLIVALPESILAEKAKVLGRLDAMKALGIGLALDRFGSGYATGARLKNLPIDLVCIDGVFIQTLARSTGDRLFVRTLIDIAQHLGIATAAEWVDDEPKAEMLRTWGADYLEGDLFGKASPAAQPAVPALRAKRA